MKCIMLSSQEGLKIILEEKPQHEQLGVFQYPVVILTMYSSNGIAKLFNHIDVSSVMMLPEGFVYYRLYIFLA